MKKTANVLIVDDSAMALLMTSHVLKKYGVTEITEATDGLKAIEVFGRALSEGHPFNLVFLDIVMPQLNGQDALKRMRALEAEAGVGAGDKAVIIMATSLHSTEDMIDAVIEGDCSDYLVKPVGAEDILGVLQKYDFYP